MTTALLHTDLYQLTMMQAYWRAGMVGEAAFEFFVRRLPPRRRFLIAAGLEQALDFLEALTASPEDVAWLRATGRFDDSFLDWLAGQRFNGTVEAVPEGTVVFPDEPLLRVVAPLPVAQLVETQLINVLHFQTVIASKAARMVLAADGKTLVDFGYRRAHGAEAGLLAARAAYMAGFAGSATVEAGKEFGVPLHGTMAHSFVQAHAHEEEAFVAFARSGVGRVVLLIDTYDTERGAVRAAAAARRLAAEGLRVHGVRLDSGDLGAHARKVRVILDDAGLPDVEIFASGGLDEDAIADLVRAGAPIDGFGVGTALTTSSDAPALDCAYKLQEYDGLARRKTSEGKATWPGRKQVFRRLDTDGRLAGDILAVDGEQADGTPLLHPVMRGGRRLAPPEPLHVHRARVAAELARLPGALRRLEPGAPPTMVRPSPGLLRLSAAVDRRLAAEGR